MSLRQAVNEGIIERLTPMIPSSLTIETESLTPTTTGFNITTIEHYSLDKPKPSFSKLALYHQFIGPITIIYVMIDDSSIRMNIPVSTFELLARHDESAFKTTHYRYSNSDGHNIAISKFRAGRLQVPTSYEMVVPRSIEAFLDDAKYLINIILHGLAPCLHHTVERDGAF